MAEQLILQATSKSYNESELAEERCFIAYSPLKK